MGSLRRTTLHTLAAVYLMAVHPPFVGSDQNKTRGHCVLVLLHGLHGIHGSVMLHVLQGVLHALGTSFALEPLLGLAACP